MEETGSHAARHRHAGEDPGLRRDLEGAFVSDDLANVRELSLLDANVWTCGDLHLLVEAAGIRAAGQAQQNGAHTCDDPGKV